MPSQFRFLSICLRVSEPSTDGSNPLKHFFMLSSMCGPRLRVSEPPGGARHRTLMKEGIGGISDEGRKNAVVYVVAYDLSADSARSKMAKYLESIGRRIQKSVFVCDLSAKEFQSARRALLSFAAAEGSEVLIIPLCNGCQGKLRHLGSKKGVFEIA